jgi:hypothetical protein
MNKVATIEIWAISADNKLLHWGPISETLEDWNQLKEAETKAINMTGSQQKEILQSNEENRKKWQRIYENHIQEFSQGCPQGWYASQNNIDKVIDKAVKLF